MENMDLEQLVSAVAKQVLEALDARKAEEVSAEGKSRILVIGDPKELPENLTGCCVHYGIEDYKTVKNILRYQRVIVTRLNFVQLADTAQGRASCPVTEALIQALLNGVDIWMLESALPHRSYAGRGSTAFYQMLEGYVQKLQIYGVKIIGTGNIRPAEAKAEKRPAPAVCCQPVAGNLITEEVAIRLLNSGGEEICIPAGAILTPSARDVFTQAKVRISRSN